MDIKIINCLVIFTICFVVIGCGPGIANQMIRITPANNTITPVQTAQCAAQQSGWNITFKDEQSLSGTKTIGMDNVPLSLNVTFQSKDDKATVIVHSPRGESLATEYQGEFLEAFSNCGASANIIK